MTLKECTKEELIFVINRIKAFAFSDGDYYLTRALNDVEYNREKKKLEKAEQWNEIATQERRKYCEFLEKYKGVPILQIPRSAILAMDECLKKAQEADRNWAALMDIDLK